MVLFVLFWHLKLWWCGLVQLLILLTECGVFKARGAPLLNLNTGCQHCWELREARLSPWKGTRLYSNDTRANAMTLWDFYHREVLESNWYQFKLPESKGIWSLSTLLGFFQSSDCNSGSIFMCHNYLKVETTVCYLKKKSVSVGC